MTRLRIMDKSENQIVMTALSGIPLIGPGDDLATILLTALVANDIQLLSGDIIAISSKIISKAEGRYRVLGSVNPSERAYEIAQECQKDPRLVQVILDESEAISRIRPGLLIARHRLGMVCANAGVDRSNVGPDAEVEEKVLLLPTNPDRSAAQLRQSLKELSGVSVALVIVDTQGRPHRNGAVGVAIGVAGLSALKDYRGKPDLFGRTLQHSEVGLADEIAGAASLLFGQAAEGTPVVLLRGVAFAAGEGCATDLIRSRERDMYP